MVVEYRIRLESGTNAKSASELRRSEDRVAVCAAAARLER